jgi:predicted type IV restriction endonuclease
LGDEELLHLLQSKIATIKNKVEQRSAHGLPTSEADTERIVIEPLLEVLGYDDWQIIQHGRDADTKGVPDYTIIYGSDNKWMLEAKSITHSLHIGDAQQVVNYANNLGAEWAVLSNGRSWHIYNAHLAKPLNQKLMFQISDLFSQEDAAETLSLLSRASMQDNRLSEAWSRQRITTLIAEQLTTQDSEARRLLRRLCSEQTSAPVSDKTIGCILEAIFHTPNASPVAFAVSMTKVDTSTNSVNDRLSGGAKVEQPTAKPATRNCQPFAQQGGPKQYTLAELAANPTLASGLRPIFIHFDNGEHLATKYWKDVAVHLVEWLVRIHGFRQVPFKVTEGGKNYVLNSTPCHSGDKNMTNPTPLQVAGSTVYMETCHNTAEKLRTFLLLMQSSDVDPQTVTVELA